MGSGKYIKHAQEKYGIQNFTKEILFIFDNPDDMYSKEAEIVNKDFLIDENTYNLKIGGFGGFDYLNNWKENPTHSTEHSRKMSVRRFELSSHEDRQRVASIAGKAARDKKTGIHAPNKKGSFLGKSHSLDTKKIISEKAKINSKGKQNSQYGSIWITNGFLNKKIKKDSSIPDGWYAGRFYGP
jgi:hypothetical protein